MNAIKLNAEEYKAKIKSLRNVIFSIYYRKLNGDEKNYAVINKHIKKNNEDGSKISSSANDDEVILYDMNAGTYKRFKINGIIRVKIGEEVYCLE